MWDRHEANESEPDSEVGTNSGVCTKCQPILSSYEKARI